VELYIFRNYTVEPLFKNFKNTKFSDYNEVSEFDAKASAFVWFYLFPVNQKSDLLETELGSYLDKLNLVLENVSPEKNIIALTIEELFSFNNLNNDFNSKKAIYNYNSILFEKAKKHSNLKIIDFRTFLQNYGLSDLIDWKYFYLTETIVSPKLSDPFHEWFVKKIDSVKKVRKKCLILDMDNTLWGGVLGEDGIDGIKLGGSYPGNAFKDFQNSILEASATGIILAACSKNNKEDVLELISKHHEQVLKESNFSSMRINWEEKVKNIKSIAEELNIGTDSIVFIDDNPVEREFVKKTFPEIAVPEFPKAPYGLKMFFKEVYETYFQTYDITEEDRNKTEQYNSNIQRKALQNKDISIENYLLSLETEITIYKANDFNISRISQMTQKTNQFNLTTRRYEIGDIKKQIEQGYLIYCAGIKDKFGDNGITALIIIKLDGRNKSAEIDSFLLSCRVLGREIEKCFLHFALNALFDLGITQIRSRFFSTQKNAQVADFYEKNGFTKVRESNNEKEYFIELKNKYDLNNYFKINIHHD
jgi:FkbH-like protein